MFHVPGNIIIEYIYSVLRRIAHRISFMWHMRTYTRNDKARFTSAPRGWLKREKILRSGFGAIQCAAGSQRRVQRERIDRGRRHWRAGATLLYAGSGVHRCGHARRSTLRVLCSWVGLPFGGVAGLCLQCPVVSGGSRAAAPADGGYRPWRADGKENTERVEKKSS